MAFNVHLDPALIYFCSPSKKWYEPGFIGRVRTNKLIPFIGIFQIQTNKVASQLIFCPPPSYLSNLWSFWMPILWLYISVIILLSLVVPKIEKKCRNRIQILADMWVEMFVLGWQKECMNKIWIATYILELRGLF